MPVQLCMCVVHDSGRCLRSKPSFFIGSTLLLVHCSFVQHTSAELHDVGLLEVVHRDDVDDASLVAL